ncbi:MAG: hypothetical protein ACQEQ0_12600, partial [Bacteroidota bacterium]
QIPFILHGHSLKLILKQRTVAVIFQVKVPGIGVKKVTEVGREAGGFLVVGLPPADVRKSPSLPPLPQMFRSLAGPHC